MHHGKSLQWLLWKSLTEVPHTGWPLLQVPLHDTCQEDQWTTHNKTPKGNLEHWRSTPHTDVRQWISLQQQWFAEFAKIWNFTYVTSAQNCSEQWLDWMHCPHPETHAIKMCNRQVGLGTSTTAMKATSITSGIPSPAEMLHERPLCQATHQNVNLIDIREDLTARQCKQSEVNNKCHRQRHYPHYTFSRTFSFNTRMVTGDQPHWP